MRPVPSSPSWLQFSVLLLESGFKMMWCYIPLTFVNWQLQYQIPGFQRKGKLGIASSLLCDLVIVIDSSGNAMPWPSPPPCALTRSQIITPPPSLAFFWHSFPCLKIQVTLRFLQKWVINLMVEVLYLMTPESCRTMNVGLDRWGR